MGRGLRPTQADEPGLMRKDAAPLKDRNQRPELNCAAAAEGFKFAATFKLKTLDTVDSGSSHCQLAEI